MKRLGPDLKMPNLKRADLKVPPFLDDLLFDLRERRLLAPLALLLVAIVAVPFLLGGGSEESAPTPGAAASLTDLEGAGAKLTVVEAQPGLRDYHKRLRDRRPTNPFKQRFTSSQVKGAGSTENSPSSTTTGRTTGGPTPSGPTSSTPSETAPTRPSTGTPGPVPGSSTESLTLFTWGIEVEVTKLPSEKVDPEAHPETTTKPRVLPQTPLPGPKTPVVTFLGLSREAAEKKEKKALLLVSDDVSKVSKNAECVSAREGCQLIEAKPGQAITLVYGPGETSYTIKVLKIEVIVTGHSERHS